MPFPAATVTANTDTADDVRCHETGFRLAAETRDRKRFASFIDDDACFVGNPARGGPAEAAEAFSVFS